MAKTKSQASETAIASKPQFTVQQSVLNEALRTCGRALSDNKIVPATEMFLFDLSQQSADLKISACNMQISISTEIALIDYFGGWGKILLPGKKLADYISKSNNEVLSFEIESHVKLDEERSDYQTVHSILITTSTGKLSLPCENGEDFPVIKTDEDLQEFTIASPDFLEMLFRTLYAVSEDQLRPAATGLNLLSTETGLSVTGIMWNYIATYSFPIILPNAIDIIIPKSTLQILQSMGLSGDILFGVCKRSIRMNFGQTVFTSLLIDETFPAFKHVIPTDNDKNFSCNRFDFIRSVKRITPFTDVSKLLRLKTGLFSSLTANNDDMAEMATESLPGKFDGGDFEVGLNSDQILAVLNSLTADTVNISFSTPKKAMIVTDGFLHEPGNRDNLVILMPVFII